MGLISKMKHAVTDNEPSPARSSQASFDRRSSAASVTKPVVVKETKETKETVLMAGQNATTSAVDVSVAPIAVAGAVQSEAATAASAAAIASDAVSLPTAMHSVALVDQASTFTSVVDVKAIELEAERTAPVTVNIIEGVEQQTTKQKEAILQETIRPRIHEEISPVIDRTREELIVHQIIQPIVDKQHVTSSVERRNDIISKETVEPITAAYTERYNKNATAMAAFRREEETVNTTVVNKSILNETVNRHILFEIQPVLQREVDQELIVRTIQPIFEKWIAAPQVADLAIAAPVTLAQYHSLKTDIAVASNVTAVDATAANTVVKTTVTKEVIENDARTMNSRAAVGAVAV